MSIDKEFLDEKDFDFSEDYFTEEPKEKISENLYHRESKTKKEKPKYEGKKNVVSVQKKKKTDAEKSAKKLISISEKNKDVLDILKKIGKKYPSESDFICQAIKEKYERENNQEPTDLKDAVKKVLEEMMGENFILMKSSSDININTVPNNNYQPQQNNIEPQQKSDENADLIRGVMDLWDE